MADETVDVESLATKILDGIKKMGRGTAADEDDSDLMGSSGKVPMERLRRQIEKTKEANKALADLGEQVTELLKARKTEMAELKGSVAEQVKAIGVQHAEDLQLVDLGVTDALGRQTIRTAWNAESKDSRGKSPAEWWGGRVKAHQSHLADPKKTEAVNVARALTPYLPQADEGGGKSAGSGGGGGKPPPTGPRKAVDQSLVDWKPTADGDVLGEWLTHLGTLDSAG